MQNLSYLGAAPDSLHPSTHHPPEAGQRVCRLVDSGQCGHLGHCRGHGLLNNFLVRG